MSIANTDQAEHWNTGEGIAHWISNHARYERMHAPFTAMILGAVGLRPGGNVLDVGCGCGGTTLAAARLVAPGQATGLDLSAPMLARARADAEASGLDNVLFVQGDAQVHPLEPARFDAVLSRFGVMFFDDPVAAFANIRSATRPAGQLVFVCWQPLDANQWLLVPGGRRGRRRRGGVPAHRVDRPDDPRRSRRPHGGPRDRVGAHRAHPVRGRRGRAPGRCGLARPGHRPVAPRHQAPGPGLLDDGAQPAAGGCERLLDVAWGGGFGEDEAQVLVAVGERP